MADSGAGLARGDKAEPVRIRTRVGRGEVSTVSANSAVVTGAPGSSRFDGDAAVADIGVNRVGKIDGCRPFESSKMLPFGVNT